MARRPPPSPRTPAAAGSAAPPTETERTTKCTASSRAGAAPSSPGRHCHSTPSLAVIDVHSLGIYTTILLSLRSLSVKMTVSPWATLARPLMRALAGRLAESQEGRLGGHEPAEEGVELLSDHLVRRKVGLGVAGTSARRGADFALQFTSGTSCLASLIGRPPAAAAAVAAAAGAVWGWGGDGGGGGRGAIRPGQRRAGDRRAGSRRTPDHRRCLGCFVAVAGR
jgi:hypothetical protein